MSVEWQREKGERGEKLHEAEEALKEAQVKYSKVRSGQVRRTETDDYIESNTCLPMLYIGSKLFSRGPQTPANGASICRDGERKTRSYNEGAT